MPLRMSLFNSSSLSTQMTARFIRAVVVSRVFCSLDTAALCTLSHCLRHGGRFHLSQSILLTREFTLLENHMIYHQAEQVSQCDWTAVVKGAQHPFIGRLCTLVIVPAAWRQVSTNENHQASTRLTFGMSRQRDVCVLLGSLCPAGKRKDHERVDWLAFETRHERDVCVLLGPSGLAHVRSVLSAVSSVRDPVVKR